MRKWYLSTMERELKSKNELHRVMTSFRNCLVDSLATGAWGDPTFPAQQFARQLDKLDVSLKTFRVDTMADAQDAYMLGRYIIGDC